VSWPDNRQRLRRPGRHRSSTRASLSIVRWQASQTKREPDHATRREAEQRKRPERLVAVADEHSAFETPFRTLFGLLLLRGTAPPRAAGSGPGGSAASDRSALAPCRRLVRRRRWIPVSRLDGGHRTPAGWAERVGVRPRPAYSEDHDSRTLASIPENALVRNMNAQVTLSTCRTRGLYHCIPAHRQFSRR
jgi:hypothetical protein